MGSVPDVRVPLGHATSGVKNHVINLPLALVWGLGDG